MLVEKRPSDEGARLKIVRDCEKLSWQLDPGEEAFKSSQKINSPIHLCLEIFTNQALIILLGDDAKADPRFFRVYGGCSGFLGYQCQLSETLPLKQLVHFFENLDLH